MGGQVHLGLVDDSHLVSAEPFNKIALDLLAGRHRQEPRHIYLLHALTSASERDELPLGPTVVCVWVRVLWPTGEESVGFAECCDAELVWGLYPDRCEWLSRVRAPRAGVAPDTREQ